MFVDDDSWCIGFLMLVSRNKEADSGPASGSRNGGLYNAVSRFHQPQQDFDYSIRIPFHGGDRGWCLGCKVSGKHTHGLVAPLHIHHLAHQPPDLARCIDKSFAGSKITWMPLPQGSWLIITERTVGLTRVDTAGLHCSSLLGGYQLRDLTDSKKSRTASLNCWTAVWFSSVFRKVRGRVPQVWDFVEALLAWCC